MDKITRIKKLVESSLETSFGKSISINEIMVLPTQKFDEQIGKWVPDSYTIFLTIKRPGNPTLNEEIYSVGGMTDASSKISNFLESFLGFEACVDVV